MVRHHPDQINLTSSHSVTRQKWLIFLISIKKKQKFNIIWLKMYIADGKDNTLALLEQHHQMI